MRSSVVSSLRRIHGLLTPMSIEGRLRWRPTLLLYMLSHGFMLASWNALYWDDWITYAGGRQGTIDFFAECTRCVVPFRGEIEGLLIAPGPWLMRLLVFVFFPIIALLTEQFLRRTQWLQKDEETIIALGVLFLPMFGARIALINFQYTISLLLFVLGAWMVLSPRQVTRLVSLVPIFWSMFTQSLQVFVVVLIVVLLAKLVVRQSAFTLDRVLVVASLLFFPMIHRYGIAALLPEFRVVDGYNTIRTSFLIRAVLVASILTLPLVAIAFRRRNGRVEERPVVLLAVGLAILAAGTFPYLAVGHFPNISDWILPLLPDQSDWNSRHQLLQPFGIAIIILGVSQMMAQYRRAFVLSVLGASICLNAATYSGYYLDSLKQSKVLNELSLNAVSLEDVDAVAINDQTHDFNARGRTVRPYEWSAIVKQRTGAVVNTDADTRQFCQEESPDLLVTVSPVGGRLRSLLRREALIEVYLSETSC